eukprot:CAMPEP_0182426066 /NCGR_PEP_ID=MMETSP1167-20130531/12550_1 /TAXON_ID=2988 /ORGANISM="Mallomonas Sp, Strain CCMP3275" /LENGTH=269 /DNA_ID=CAMNT_0024607239 /DNA_START=54 /DNA_END=864 /DNA_ORIENTATION=+
MTASGSWTTETDSRVDSASVSCKKSLSSELLKGSGSVVSHSAGMTGLGIKRAREPSEKENFLNNSQRPTELSRTIATSKMSRNLTDSQHVITNISCSSPKRSDKSPSISTSSTSHSIVSASSVGSTSHTSLCSASQLKSSQNERESVLSAMERDERCFEKMSQQPSKRARALLAATVSRGTDGHNVISTTSSTKSGSPGLTRLTDSAEKRKEVKSVLSQVQSLQVNKKDNNNSQNITAVTICSVCEAKTEPYASKIVDIYVVNHVGENG